MSSNGLEHGGVAQLARANGSYPLGRWFEPTRRYQWPVGQAVKTPPFHGGNTSSNLVRVTIFGSIAQLGEHLPYKQRVIGSSPIVPTRKKTSFGCLFSVIFAYGKLYCYAVIFGLRQVVLCFAQLLANIISLKP